MKITIEKVEPFEHRYNTIGDWYYEDGVLVIKASGKDDDDAFLIALHELCEAWLCTKHGITTDDVDNFDMAYAGDGEPGDSIFCPYKKEHRFAMLIEQMMAHELGRPLC